MRRIDSDKLAVIFTVVILAFLAAALGVFLIGFTVAVFAEVLK